MKIQTAKEADSYFLLIELLFGSTQDIHVLLWFCYLPPKSSPLATAQAGGPLIPLQTNGFAPRLH